MAKSLIIVESPAKARTLQKYLGASFEVKASVGHIRDLPVKTLGVDIENGFTPQYVTIRGKGKVITDLQNAAKKAEKIYLAPDPDREGEAIAYHIAEALRGAKKPVYRVLFHELTKKAILAAIEGATDLNYRLFEAQQTRRILDRLVGYQISPLLWDKVRRGLSAGRVQSVAVRMVCEREEEINKFVSEEYWSIVANLQATLPPPFAAKLEKIKGKKSVVRSEAEASAVCAELRQSAFQVAKVEKKSKKRHPTPPFITSTLQMDANRKRRFSAKKTMMLAQRLYEGIELGDDGPTGLITYMRTDSTRINDDALAEVRNYINSAYGAEYVPAKANIYKTNKAAQDAHEAIRPTDVAKTPESLAPFLEKDMLALYTLIWKRFIASQMAPAVYDQTAITIDAGSCQLKTVGSIMRFLGFMTLYTEAADDSVNPEEQAAQAEGENATLPDLQEGDQLQCREIVPKQHFTQPPPRYSEASLVKALEENGVGRPSTYATILSTIQDKEYVQLLLRKFSPTDLGKLINELLVDHFPTIMDVEFTASMEKDLDQVEEGKIQWLEIMEKFYAPFKETLALAKQEMKSVKRSSVPTGIPCALCDGKMVIKWGKMGEFLACEKYPECKNTQDFKKGDDGQIVPIAKDAPEETDQVCPKCGRAMVYKHGKYGRFMACSGYPECKQIVAEGTGVNCPEPGCDGEIVKKVSKRGKTFYSCNRYPKCTYAVWDKPVKTPCPLCEAPFLLEKISKKGGAQLKCASKDCKYSHSLATEGEEE